MSKQLFELMQMQEIATSKFLPSKKEIDPIFLKPIQNK